MEISRFRYQVNSGSASNNSNNEEIKKISETLERKNSELQQTRRTLEQKILANKELEQRVTNFEQQVNDKIF